MRITHYLAVTGLILFMACGGERKGGGDTRAEAAAESASTPVAPTIAVLLLCGADTISVQGAREDTLQLNVMGESFVVGLVPSGSGVKYQAGADTTTFYWNLGNRALVQVRGEAFPECDLLPGA